jgi:hypothetical protein
MKRTSQNVFALGVSILSASAFALACSSSPNAGEPTGQATARDTTDGGAAAVCTPQTITADALTTIDTYVKPPTARPRTSADPSCTAAEITAITTGVTTYAQLFDKVFAQSDSCKKCLVGQDLSATNYPLFVFDGAPTHDYSNFVMENDWACVWHETPDTAHAGQSPCGAYAGKAGLCGNIACGSDACAADDATYSACQNKAWDGTTSVCASVAATEKWAEGCDGTALKNAETKCGSIFTQIGLECGVH